MEIQEDSFFRTSIKALIVDKDGKFLLAREEGGWWDFLGGGLHFGETVEHCLRREIMEETGLTVASVALNPSYFVTFRKNNGRWYSNVFFKVELKDLAFTPSDECQELRYFDEKSVTMEKSYPNLKLFTELYY